MPHDFQLWCEDCQKGYDGECEEHGPLTHVSDTEVGTRARRSLPRILELKETRNQIGVFAKETLAKRLQFGPLQGVIERQPSKQLQFEEEIRNKYAIVYKLVTKDDDLLLIDTRSEDRSNWMIFVKPAERKSEQNLVAFQYKGEIFFATIKEIPSHCELKVWFSKDYAESMGMRVLYDDSSSWQFRTRQKFTCLSCEVVFSSASSLANHRCSKSKQLTKTEGFPSRKRVRKSTSPVVSSAKVFPVTSEPSTSVEPSASVKVEEKSIPLEIVSAKLLPTKAKEKKPVKVKEKTRHLLAESESSESEEAAETKLTPGRGTYQCSVCKKVFHSPGKLKQHSYSHTGERPFSCPHCQKAFSSRFKLGRHQLIHTGVRQHQCPHCSRSFHRKDHLKNHIQIHDPNKQFKCERPECGKEYNSYMSYRKHCAVHAAEEGDLECKICLEMFDSKTDLIYHLKVHVGTRTVKSPSEKKFQCDFCERRFFTRKDVKRHLVVHTGKRDFVCSLCPQKFGRKDHLVRHIKKSHGVSDPSRLETSDPLAVPGPSSAPQALSPEAAIMSSTSASSEDQSITSLLIGEPVPGPSGLPSTSAVSGKLFVEPTSLEEQPSETYEAGTFPGEFRFFEEGIKEEPELTASITDPGGDDISKILGMYLPSGSINLPVPPMLEAETSGAAPLQREAITPLQISQGATVSLSAPLFIGSSLTPAHLIETSASEELGPQIYQLPPGTLLATTTVSSQISAEEITGPREEGEIASQPVSPTITGTTTTTTTVTTTLPGFGQAFP